MQSPGYSAEGASNTTSAREPLAASNKLDRNFKRRVTLVMHKGLYHHLPTMTPLDQKPIFRVADSPYYNSYPMRPSGKWPPLDKRSVLPPLGKFEPWPSLENIDFKRYMPTPAPPPAFSPVALVVRTLVVVMAAFAAFLIMAVIRRKKASRTRRGKVNEAVAVPGSLSISADQPSIPSYPRQPLGQGESGWPCNDDLSPAYYECALSSIKKYVSDEPPPYADYEDTGPHVHARRQSAFIENELGAKAITTTSNDSGDVAPEMKTELVFHNGRIVERLSLELDGKNFKAEIASNDNVDQRSTTRADVKDTVMYVDETDNVKVNFQ